MAEKSHWPFGGDPWDRGGRDPQRVQAGGKTSATEQHLARQRARNDRLIVGGRAHAKKSGLS